MVEDPSPSVTITVMNNVSIQDVRFDFARVKRALERGEVLTLTYRNKPLARLTPLVGSQKEGAGPDPALEFGLSGEALSPMTNEEIDRTVYG